jgi:hypothetical protein
MECTDGLAISLQTAGLPGQKWIIAFAGSRSLGVIYYAGDENRWNYTIQPNSKFQSTQ